MSMKAPSSPAGMGEPVAWRWHWNAGDEPDVWAYSETPIVSDEHRTAYPLYAHPETPVQREAVIDREAIALADEIHAAINAYGQCHDPEEFEHLFKKANALLWNNASTICVALRSLAIPPVHSVEDSFRSNSTCIDGSESSEGVPLSPLSKNAVYETLNGPAEFIGMDHFHGETTYKFDETGWGRPRYIKPENLARYLLRDNAHPPLTVPDDGGQTRRQIDSSRALDGTNAKSEI